MGKYQLKTKKGYDFFEVSGSLQKCIRRGLEDEAMYWAVELFNSNYAEYVWKRLRIIASEDVGLAYPGIAADIAALYANHREQAKKKEDANKPERLFLTHAVLLLCRAPKSRIVDWTLIYHWMRHDHVMLEVPNFALDKHNDRGRALGRGFKHFFEEGSHLENMANAEEDAFYKARAEQAISFPSQSLFGDGAGDDPRTAVVNTQPSLFSVEDDG